MVGTWSKVLTSTKLQELRVGYTHFDWKNLLAVSALATGVLCGTAALNGVSVEVVSLPLPTRADLGSHQ